MPSRCMSNRLLSLVPVLSAVPIRSAAKSRPTRRPPTSRSPATGVPPLGRNPEHSRRATGRVVSYSTGLKSPRPRYGAATSAIRFSPRNFSANSLILVGRFGKPARPPTRPARPCFARRARGRPAAWPVCQTGLQVVAIRPRIGRRFFVPLSPNGPCPNSGRLSDITQQGSQWEVSASGCPQLVAFSAGGA